MGHEKMWKTVHGSVAGTSHQLAGTPCQDCSRVRQLGFDHSNALVLACSDGAGSAKHSERGSLWICERFIEIIEREVAAGLTLDKLDRGHVIDWCVEIRKGLNGLAVEHDAQFRDFAATFLGAVIHGNHACFLQIGDGAIVAQYDGLYEVVFWPQSGEYINTTNFLTDERFDSKLDFRVQSASDASGLALFTDGIERLVLQYADKTVHIPFLEPLFDSLAAHESVELNEPLKAFLNSKEINDRTDDDKTLVLALRTAATADGNATV
jgi:hypothetical protein